MNLAWPRPIRGRASLPRGVRRQPPARFDVSRATLSWRWTERLASDSVLTFHPIAAMNQPVVSDEVRKFLSAIGAKGGKRKTPKKMAQFAKAQVKGGQTVTPKKLTHLAKARAARAAKLELRKGSP